MGELDEIVNRAEIALQRNDDRVYHSLLTELDAAYQGADGLTAKSLIAVTAFRLSFRSGVWPLTMEMLKNVTEMPEFPRLHHLVRHQTLSMLGLALIRSGNMQAGRQLFADVLEQRPHDSIRERINVVLTEALH